MKTMSSERDIRELDRTWAAAEVAADADLLDALAVDGFTLVGPLGFVLTREQWSQRYRSGDLHTESLDWQIETLHLHGDTAVTIGTHTQTATYQGHRADGRFRSTHVMVQVDDAWKVAAIQLSAIGSPAPTQPALQLNHTIVRAYDRQASAVFLADILGLHPDPDDGHFVPLRIPNGVTLDYLQTDDVQGQHYAFMVSDALFDAAFARLTSAGIEHWADPMHHEPGINQRLGGRGVYFQDPSGHNMELLTKVS